MLFFREKFRWMKRKMKKKEAEMVWNLLRFLTIISNLYGSLAVFDSSVFEMLTRFPFELYNLSRSLTFASAAALNVSGLKRKSRFWKSLLEMKKSFFVYLSSRPKMYSNCIRCIRLDWKFLQKLIFVSYFLSSYKKYSENSK